MNKLSLLFLTAILFLIISNEMTGQIISGGGYHTVAICDDSTARAWGKNDFGQLGNGTTTHDSIPHQISGLTGLTAITGGDQYTLALKSDGTAWAVGLNNNGQLGDSTTTNKSLPVKVKGLSNAIAITCGVIHSLALRSDGTVWAWGQIVTVS